MTSSSAPSLPRPKQPLFFYGWVVVAVAFVTLGVAFGVWYSFSVFFLAIIQEFGWTRASVSGIMSVFILSQSSMGMVSGHLQDRFGPRLAIPFGTLVLAGCLALTSQAQNLWHFYVVYGVVAGAGVSLLGFSSHSAFIPKWFERKRGLALGIAMSGIGVGMLILIPLVEKSISLWGWRNTFLYLAGVVLFLVGPLNLIFSRRRPEDLGLRPDGDSAHDVADLRRPSFVVKIVDTRWADQDWTLKRAVRTPRFWFLMAAFAFGSYTYQGILLHAIPAMVDVAFSRTMAAYYFGILGLAGSAGKILFGYLSDLYGREKVNTFAGVVTTLGMVCLLGISQGGALMPLLFALLFGLGYGAAAPLFPAVCADIFIGRSFGLIFAVICMGGGTGGSMGPFVNGLVRDLSGTYFWAFILCLISLTLSCLFVWLAAPSKVKRIIRA